MTQLNSHKLINKWLMDTIIGLNLCPFAKAPFEAGEINIQVSTAATAEVAYQSFINEIEIIANGKATTSLLGFSQLNLDFLSFNDFIGSLEEALEDNDLADVFQLVCFHPEFIFEDTNRDDLANFVNRSPMPLIHILKRIDVSVAMNSTQASENISFLNEKTIKALSISELKRYFWYLY